VPRARTRAWHGIVCRQSSGRSGTAPRTEPWGFSNHNSALLAMRLWTAVSGPRRLAVRTHQGPDFTAVFRLDRATLPLS
jgi:hypothetical protein